MKKWITTLVLAGAVLMPSAGVLAAPTTELADAIYGSYSDVKQEQQDFKMEEYKAFNEKLQAAKAVLGAEEYAKFESLLKPFAAFMVSVDPSRLTPEQEAEQQRLMTPLIPYFDLLNEAAEQTAVQHASPFQYADAIYGSFADLKKAVPGTTMEEYKRFNAKMAAAFETLGADEFAKFQALVKEMTALSLPYYDDNGQLDPSQMTPEDQAHLQAVMAQLQPYFERLG